MKEIRLKTIMKRVVMFIGVLLALNVLYFAFMTLAFSIPAEGKVKENMGNSLFTWQKDTAFPIFDDGKSYWYDLQGELLWANIAVNYTDNPIATTIEMPYTEVSGQAEGDFCAPLIQALYYPDAENSIHTSYSRYWMLIAGVFRILFLVWEIKEIRYIFYFTVLALAFLLLYKVNKILGWRGYMPLCVAMASRVWFMQAICATTLPDILISLLAMLSLISLHKSEKYVKYQEMLFFVIGSVSFAFGPLIAPLTTLGMTLILNIMLLKQKDNDKIAWVRCVTNSIAWAAGYLGSIACKSILAKITLENQTATESIMYWLGPGQGVKERLGRIVYCIEGLLSPINVKLPIFIILVVIIILLIIKRGFENFRSKFIVLFVTLYPVFWVFIVVEHSIHYYADNIFSVFVYGLFTVMVCMVSDKRKNDITEKN